MRDERTRDCPALSGAGCHYRRVRIGGKLVLECTTLGGERGAKRLTHGLELDARGRGALGVAIALERGAERLAEVLTAPPTRRAATLGAVRRAALERADGGLDAAVIARCRRRRAKLRDTTAGEHPTQRVGTKRRAVVALEDKWRPVEGEEPHEVTLGLGGRHVTERLPKKRLAECEVPDGEHGGKHAIDRRRGHAVIDRPDRSRCAPAQAATESRAAAAIHTAIAAQEIGDLGAWRPGEATRQGTHTDRGTDLVEGGENGVSHPDARAPERPSTRRRTEFATERRPPPARERSPWDAERPGRLADTETRTERTRSKTQRQVTRLALELTTLALRPDAAAGSVTR